MSDLDGVCMVRRGKALVPADVHAEEIFADIAEGREIIVSLRKVRNPSHHRYFFALLRKVCENSDDWAHEDELLDALKLAAGHTERRMKLDGSAYLAPRSISFAAMDQGAFRRFYNRCVHLLATKVLHCSPEELMGEVETTQRRAA